ncbi:MAG: DMT family transporter [Kiloniellales bacterium]
MSERTLEQKTQAPLADKDVAGLDIGLYLMTVLVWGTSWIALKWQLGVVAPEVSVFWRFLAAALVMVVWLALSGKTWRFPISLHLRFAAMGACLFCFNYFFFYIGGAVLPSGLLSVIFSMASVINLFLAALVLGAKLSGRSLLAAAIGVVGIACLFWPEVVGAELNLDALKALLLCLLATTIFCIGNMISAGLQRRRIPVVSATTWGMIYGTSFLGVIGLARGQAFIVEESLRYLGSLAYLAVFASVIAFAGYLTLLGRIGAGRAGYATVLFPVVAMAISSVLEGYSWTWIAIVGVVLALGGNVLILTGARR